MVLQDEISRWKVNDNVLIFKASRNSPLIYIAFLKERTITAIKHPYGEEEVDMIYFDNLLLVAQHTNVRYVHISPKDAVTPMKNYNSGASEYREDNQLPLLDKVFAGLIFNYPQIIGLIHNHLRRELIFVQCDPDPKNCHQLFYHRMIVIKSEGHHHDSDHFEYKLDFETYIPAAFDTKNRK
jgi:hypothetical protein